MAIKFLPALPAKREKVNFSYADDDQTRMQRAVIKLIERAGGQRRLYRLYQQYRQDPGGEDFFQAAVRLLGLDVNYDPAALMRIPRDGPVVFIANHPFGVLDGIVLSWLARRIRPDTKVLAHSALLRVPEMRPALLPVDFSMTRAAQKTNIASRAAARKWLQDGHAIGIFPGGGVSTTPGAFERIAHDLPWAPFTWTLIGGAKASVVPVHFSGQNSVLFQLASHVSETLRLSLLFLETARRIGTRLDVEIGRPIAASELDAFGERQAIMDELRRRTFALAPQTHVDWMQPAILPPTRAMKRAARAAG